MRQAVVRPAVEVDVDVGEGDIGDGGWGAAEGDQGGGGERGGLGEKVAAGGHGGVFGNQ